MTFLLEPRARGLAAGAVTAACMYAATTNGAPPGPETNALRTLDLRGGRPLLPRLREEWRRDLSAIEQQPPLASNFRVVPPRSERFTQREKSLMLTRVWAALDRDHLVVHFLCLDPGMDKAVPPKVRKGLDAKVWNDDSVDVAIDVRNDKESYCYLAASRTGALWDSAHEIPYKVNTGWTSGARVDVGTRPDAWTASLWIPLASLGGRPAHGDVVSFSFGRIKLFNKETLQAALPEDAIAIEYEKKLEKRQMREESSNTPFAGYNWYSFPRKILYPINFLETVVAPEKPGPVRVLSTTLNAVMTSSPFCARNRK